MLWRTAASASGTPVEQSDAGVTEPYVVSHGGASRNFIFKGHRSDKTAVGEVDEHGGYCAAEQHPEDFLAHVVAHLNEHTVEPTLADKSWNRLLDWRHPPYPRQQNHVAVSLGLFLHAAHELDKDRVGEVGHDKRDDIRARDFDRADRFVVEADAFHVPRRKFWMMTSTDATSRLT